MNYQTFQPGEELNLLFICYWALESSVVEQLEKQSVVPDGCIEIFFHYGDHAKQYTSRGKSIIQPRILVISQLTRPLEIGAIRLRCS